MKKLLVISKLDFNHLSMIEKALPMVSTRPIQITLHYSYQIPSDIDNVIANHDAIKKAANIELTEKAAKIQLKTGIQTGVNLSLGSTENTVKRILNNSNFHYVLYFDNILNVSIRNLFPNVKFLNL